MTHFFRQSILTCWCKIYTHAGINKCHLIEFVQNSYKHRFVSQSMIVSFLRYFQRLKVSGAYALKDKRSGRKILP